MRTAKCSRGEWQYNRAYGLAGLLAAAVIIVAMRHDMAPALALAVAITSGTGRARRRPSVRPPEAAGPGDVS
jgi:hypothetical protein